MRTKEIEIVCKICHMKYSFLVNPTDYYDWSDNGVLIQNAMPYLSADERELFISQTCGKCFDNLFKNDLED